jgi:hypothetical protein
MRNIPQSGFPGAVVSWPRSFPQEARMSRKDTKNPAKRDGELSEQQLDSISGGQEVRKMGTIVVTAKRPPAQEQKVVKMETIVVTAQREKPEATPTRLASVNPGKLRK